MVTKSGLTLLLQAGEWFLAASATVAFVALVREVWLHFFNVWKSMPWRFRFRTFFEDFWQDHIKPILLFSLMFAGPAGILTWSMARDSWPFPSQMFFFGAGIASLIAFTGRDRGGIIDRVSGQLRKE